MSWKIVIEKDCKEGKCAFFDVIKNFNYSGTLIFKERNTLRKIDIPTLGTLAVKSFKKPHLINRYIYTNFRPSKASRSYYNAKKLLSKGIHTPTPLAYFEEKKNGKLLRSFYFSEYYAYDFTFRELIEKRDLFPDWNLIIQSFTEFIYKVHNASILFKDLSPGNVLIRKNGNVYEFSLIDLNRMSFRTLSMDERLQNFIRLSLTDEMIPIIGTRYAELNNQETNKLIEILTVKNKEYIHKKDRKKNIKRLLGKS